MINYFICRFRIKISIGEDSEILCHKMTNKKINSLRSQEVQQVQQHIAFDCHTKRYDPVPISINIICQTYQETLNEEKVGSTPHLTPRVLWCVKMRNDPMCVEIIYGNHIYQCTFQRNIQVKRQVFVECLPIYIHLQLCYNFNQLKEGNICSELNGLFDKV